MTDDEATRGPQVEFLIDYWGGCPECGMQDGDCDLDEGAAWITERTEIISTPDVWWYCDIHRTRWSPGLHSSRPVYGEERRRILSYRVVPYREIPDDPVWVSGATPESVAEKWAAIRARFSGNHAVHRPPLFEHAKSHAN